MKLANLIDPRLVLTGQKIGSLDEVIETAVQAASTHYNIDVKDALFRVRQREAQSSTVLPSGIAVPHARIEGFDNFIIAPVIPAIPLNSLSGTKVRIVWLVLSNPSSAGTYLNVLKSLVLLSQNTELFEKLLDAEDGRRFIGILEEADWKCSKVLKVEDIMTKEVVTIGQDASLQELIDLMWTKRLRYVPVVETSGRLVGEIGVLDIIAAGIPDYANRLEGLAFLSELEPMEILLKNEGTMRVSSIMKPPVAILEPDSSVVDVAFRMVRSKKRHFPVLSKDRIVGVVSSMDILAKLLRA